MEPPLLPLEIASGILLAVVIVWIFRLGVLQYERQNYYGAFVGLTLAALLGGGLILAGLGVTDY